MELKKVYGLVQALCRELLIAPLMELKSGNG